MVTDILRNGSRDNDEILFFILIDFEAFENPVNGRFLHVGIPKHDRFDCVASNDILRFVFDSD